MKKWLIIVGLLVVVVIAGAATYVATLDRDQYKDEIVDLISNAIGRQISVGGEVDFKWKKFLGLLF